MRQSPIFRLLQHLAGSHPGMEDSPPAIRNHPALDAYYDEVKTTILERQNILTGLLPASTAVNSHGDYTDAWVRDNVYSILSAWGLALAYRRQNMDPGRCYLLEQSVVKLMRGLMLSMMRQAHKIERFKHTQHATDALHAKYSTQTGEPVVGDHEWGHLQLDATSLYLLMLAQMTASGLRIVFTLDEVNFVQNLVHYISRAYRTPDYGIWERGNKLNHGEPELNASSIGLAKAALEALAGFNLFGAEGGQASVIHVIEDDIARTRIALNALIPRESVSKEVDAALLAVVGFPAFALDDPDQAKSTFERITEKLEGPYGLKRFLLDGHQTVVEDPHRLHYEPEELQEFHRIECEWPLFFTYLLLTHLFKGNHQEAERYLEKLTQCSIERDGQKLLPELYFVPRSKIPAEKEHPGSQAREPNDNVPLVWAQSLFLLGRLLHAGWIKPEDIDPLGRSLGKRAPQGIRVQVALLAQSESVKRELRKIGFPSQTAKEILPLRIHDAAVLSRAYLQVGRNDRLGLSGRPLRLLRSLTSSRIYLLASTPVLFIPQFLSQKGFYLAIDNTLLVQRFQTELAYISGHWDRTSDPLIVMEMQENMLKSLDHQVLIDFIRKISKGRVGSVKVKLCKLSDFSEETALEKIESLHDFRLEAEPEGHVIEDGELSEIKLRLKKLDWQEEAAPFDPLLELGTDADLMGLLLSSLSPRHHVAILTLLVQRHSLDHPLNFSEKAPNLTLRAFLEGLYQSAADHHAWFVLRHCAGLLGKYDIDLEQSATEILVRQHALTLGKAYSRQATFHNPVDSFELLAAIRECNPGGVSQEVLIQELIIALGLLIKEDATLFKDMHTIRVGHILDMIIADELRVRGGTLDQAYSRVLQQPPHQITARLKETLSDYSKGERQLGHVESLHTQQLGHLQGLEDAVPEPSFESCNVEEENWAVWREKVGCISRESEAFYDRVWNLLGHCRGIVIGERYNSQQRLDSQKIRSHMTPGEKSFRLKVTHLLDKIPSPVYRQLTVEALDALSQALCQNPEIEIEDTLVIDILLGHAVRLNWIENHPDAGNYQESVDAAWQAFTESPPPILARAVRSALGFLLEMERSNT